MMATPQRSSRTGGTHVGSAKWVRDAFILELAEANYLGC